MFAQSLPGIKRKQGQGPRLLVEQGLTDDRSVGIFDHFRQFQHLATVIGFFCHVRSPACHVKESSAHRAGLHTSAFTSYAFNGRVSSISPPNPTTISSATKSVRPLRPTASRRIWVKPPQQGTSIRTTITLGMVV